MSFCQERTGITCGSSVRRYKRRIITTGKILRRTAMSNAQVKPRVVLLIYTFSVSTTRIHVALPIAAM
jgi:hypothetical protein